jgi:3-hydroxyisobutyrate dehydrogenase-like beta-hydroxyacid dehydrogenase
MHGGKNDWDTGSEQMSDSMGVLHPGEMGISVAASAKNSGLRVYWASQGRSSATRARAEQHGLLDCGTLEALCAVCDVIVSVCPPHAAMQVARQVKAAGFGGLFVDANAIAPQHMQQIARELAEADIGVVDGGIIGGPAWQPGQTWLYLSGPRAAEAAECFSSGPLETRVLSDDVGQASALKMCYAGYNKGTTALLCAVLAAAEQLGVRQALEAHWGIDSPDQATRAAQRVRGVTRKAWRFEGEMYEIAATLADAGLPDGFHRAAAGLYQRLAHFNGRAELPSLEEVLAALVPQPSSARLLPHQRDGD